MAEASFIERLLEVRITLRAGAFREGLNTKIITGLPIKAHIEKTGPPDCNKATVEIRGMLPEDMDAATTLGFGPRSSACNSVAVYAGNAREGMHLAFSGEITRAAAGFSGSPDTAFTLEGMTGHFGKTTPAGPAAIAGSQPAAEFIAMQARAMGYEFRNEGVTARLANAVFSGSPMDKARAAGIWRITKLTHDLNAFDPSGGSWESLMTTVYPRQSNAGNAL